LKLRTVVMGAGLAGALALGYWLGVHREERRSTSAADHSIAATPAVSTGANVAVASTPAAARLVEEAREQHFAEFHSVQDALALPSGFARREALYTIAGRADQRDLEALIAEAKGLPNPAERAAALEVLYLSYVERDPQRALQSALALPDSEARNDELARVGDAWARIAPQAAFQQAGFEADPSVRAALQNAIVYAWASKDAAAAFTSVLARPAGAQRDQLLRWTTRELARQHPQRAAELIEPLKPSDTDTLYAVLAYEWARNDVRAAARWLAEQPRQRRGTVGYYVATSYGARFPAEALEWASRLDQRRNRGLWYATLVGVSEQDSEAALQLAAGLKDPGRRTAALSAVIGAIAARDPGLAMRHFERLPAGDARSQIVVQIAMQLSQTDPSAAVAWVTSLSDRNARSNGLQQIGQVLAQRDIEAASALTGEIPAESRAEWVGAIASAYVQYDVDAAIEWMKKNASLPNYVQVLQKFCWDLAMQDADAAFEFATGITDGKQREGALQSVIATVAMQAPQDAARWVDEIRDDSLQRDAVGQVAAQWVEVDPGAARKWVLSLDSSALRDRGLVALVGASSTDEVEPLLEQIHSADLRMDAVFRAALRLAGEDVKAMRTLLLHHPLDPQRQQQLETILKQQYGKSW
jgi:hypothetical protein